MFGDSSGIQRYFVYSYEHLDDLSFLRDPKQVFAELFVESPVEEWLTKVGDLFRRHGWEGDGQLRIMWFPPFADLGVEDTWGTYVWTVKQSNNGTAYIASPHELPFKRLLAQNNNRPVWNGFVPIGKARAAHRAFIEGLAAVSSQLDLDLAATATLAERQEPIRLALLERVQGQMVQSLHSFMDDCYLNLLVDVITEGNRSGLKLRKASVKLNPGNYLPETADSDTDGWFTLRGLVSDMWRDYQFQPFEEKLDMLCRPVGFAGVQNTMFVLRQHVFLRNCIQHHEGRVEAKGLERLGRQAIELEGPNAKNVTIHPWKPIFFPLEELRRFERELRAFATAFDHRVEERLVGREYIRPDESEAPQ